MLITALEEADEEQKRELKRWLEAGIYEPAEKIAAVTAIYNEIGVGPRCEAKIEALYAEGLKVLDEVSVPLERKEVLKAFVCSLMDRKV